MPASFTAPLPTGRKAPCTSRCLMISGPHVTERTDQELGWGFSREDGLLGSFWVFFSFLFLIHLLQARWQIWTKPRARAQPTQNSKPFAALTSYRQETKGDMRKKQAGSANCCSNILFSNPRNYLVFQLHGNDHTAESIFTVQNNLFSQNLPSFSPFVIWDAFLPNITITIMCKQMLTR